MPKVKKAVDAKNDKNIHKSHSSKPKKIKANSSKTSQSNNISQNKVYNRRSLLKAPSNVVQPYHFETSILSVTFPSWTTDSSIDYLPKNTKSLSSDTFSFSYNNITYYDDNMEEEPIIFSEADKLGEGGFGKVFKATCGKMSVAIKVLHQDITYKHDFTDELYMLAELNESPNIVKLLGTANENGQVRAIITELMHGTLSDLIKKNQIPEFSKIKILLDCCAGFIYIIEKGFLHRDIKASNILLGDNYKAKIGDAGTICPIANLNVGLVGTLCYLAKILLEQGIKKQYTIYTPETEFQTFIYLLVQVILDGRASNITRVGTDLKSYEKLTALHRNFDTARALDSKLIKNRTDQPILQKAYEQCITGEIGDFKKLSHYLQEEKAAAEAQIKSNAVPPKANLTPPSIKLSDICPQRI